ncbi:MAG TPA: glycosyltransferase family 4 protein [Tepidisphaeraceae bacterium]|jgi:glycosyltransferase involved in cell wall biosynthesis|nr:glycosyltransferase family 4 protein [Tepidisphaeraceae bacterium]
MPIDRLTSETSAASIEVATPAPLRVLLIVESSGGGTGRHVCDLADGLTARGCEVHMVYSPTRADRMFMQRLGELPDLRAVAMPMRTGIHPSDLHAVRAIRRYMRQNGPFDVVHGHSSKGGALARLAGFCTGAKVVYTLHGLIMMDPGLAWWKRTFYQAIERVLSWGTSLIVAVSPEEARAAIRIGLGQSRVITVPNGIGPMKLTDRTAARQALGVASDAVVIGFVGRLVEQKAPDVLLKAFAATVRQVPQSRLAMVGAGPLDASLRELAAKLGVTDKVIWLGERDARELLAAFDIFALSSRKEGLPYVIIEAMAAGHPIVATRSAGVEILIEPGRNGAMVEAGDVDGFAAALTELAANPASLARSGRESRRMAARFTTDAMVNDTLGAFHDVVGDARRSAARVQQPKAPVPVAAAAPEMKIDVPRRKQTA